MTAAGAPERPGAPPVPAHRPPHGLPGLDPRWSREVRSPDAEGVERTWHVLDTGAPPDDAPPSLGTVVCVHGNPTWSYLWRRVLAAAPRGWRVVAVDQLGMGWSERPREPRRLAQRIEDLDRLVTTLGLPGPLVLLAHDWGGPVGLGWAQRRPDLAAVVLTNTGVHQPEGTAAPALIRLARSGPLRDAVCRRTPAFVRATTALSRPRPDADVRDTYAAPYGTPDRRRAVADFVADIPLEPAHPSRRALETVRDGLAGLGAVPALLLWGTRDPVFGRRYLDDLARRLPHADVQVYPGASHLVLEDRPAAVDVLWHWLQERVGPGALERGHPAGPAVSSGAAPVEIAVEVSDPDRLAVVELGSPGRRITAGELADRVARLAAALDRRGVGPGRRVAVLVPPGIDLTTLVYAVWRLGAVVVVADPGLGLRRLAAALRGSAPDHVVAGRRGRILADLGRVPGDRVAADPADLETLVASETVRHPPGEVDPEADGAVLFTSGATGAPKGVVYSRRALGAQVALLRDAFGLVPGERFVAAFAPFALHGPALGLTACVPDMDPAAPETLTAARLADAVAAVDAGVLFASPAGLRAVVDSAQDLTAAQRAVLGGPRLVLSAGAPVPVALLRRLREVLPTAQTQTPYGMTEVLPVATTDPTTEPEGDGVCVGRPLDGVGVRIAPLSEVGVPGEDLTVETGVLGEVVVSGPHLLARYDRAWAVHRCSARPAGWHRTGDVGRLDDAGRLWVLGRVVHLVSTPEGPVPPYGVEGRVEAVAGVRRAALVGVGPAGTQQVVVVVVPEGDGPRVPLLPPAGLADRVRAAAGVPVAAVLQRRWLPVDIRHASKVDRTALARWATARLHGREDARRAFAGVEVAPARRGR